MYIFNLNWLQFKKLNDEKSILTYQNIFSDMSSNISFGSYINPFMMWHIHTRMNFQYLISGKPVQFTYQFAIMWKCIDEEDKAEVLKCIAKSQVFTLHIWCARDDTTLFIKIALNCLLDTIIVTLNIKQFCVRFKYTQLMCMCMWCDTIWTCFNYWIHGVINETDL